MTINPKWSALAWGAAALCAAVGVGLSVYPAQAAAPPPALGDHAAPSQESDPDPNNTDSVEWMDHAQFDILQQEFASGPEVTAVCLSCHTEAATEIQQTSHWTWEFKNPDSGQLLGKQNVINNFCVATTSNEPRCTSCHTGYGWEDNTFDFTNEESVDCLVCHDTTATYKKFPTAAGHPTYEPKEFPAGSGIIWEPPDLSLVAQNVGPTSRSTCGACHFYGGGADGVKHGDMDSSLAYPNTDLDVHMDAAGLDFSCTACHTSDGHEVQGSRYAMNSTDEQTCESCHTAEPHQYEALNQHIERIACQTCHVPEYARGGVATKMFWDWSQAGELNDDGSLKLVKDESGHLIYDSRKGSFVYGENVQPEYIWFNGELDYTLLSDTFDADQLLVINAPQGQRKDETARIWPMKGFNAIQPYDSQNNTLVIPHLYGKDDNAYWGNYDWQKAIEFGMEYAGAEFSGEYSFIETRMYWPITHMVAPASEALVCRDCHTDESSRLDFVALGYSPDEALALTNFPPTAGLGTVALTSTAPEDCAECHENEHTVWANSTHGAKGVGCIACHALEGEGGHPDVAYSISQESNLCGACHLDEYHDWEKSGHAAAELNCVACHQPHDQSQRITEGMTSCESCHHDQAAQTHASTHAAEGITCLDCHKETEINTGHTFTMQADSCTQCHAEEIHTANALLAANLGEQDSAGEPGSALPTSEAESTTGTPAPVEGANILIPIWGYILLGLIIGAAGFWIIAGKEPGIGAEELEEKE